MGNGNRRCHIAGSLKSCYAVCRKVSLDEMQKKFGDESIWVYNILRGIDLNPGKLHRVAIRRSALTSFML